MGIPLRAPGEVPFFYQSAFLNQQQNDTLDWTMAVHVNKSNNSEIMKRIFPILSLAALLCGCAGIGERQETIQDRFTNCTINQTKGNNLPTMLGENAVVYFDMRQQIKSDGATNCFLIINSASFGSTILIPQAFSQSLFVIADENRFSFSYTDHQENQFFYPVSPSDLKTIAHASDVEIRVIQINGQPFEKKLNQQNRSNLRQFADKFLN